MLVDQLLFFKDHYNSSIALFKQKETLCLLEEDDFFDKFIKKFSNINYSKNILANHYYNSRLWFFEDKARDTNATDSEIASVKRAIDKFNQFRNDYIEKINQDILVKVKQNIKSPLFSETPGSIIDRLSIMELKVFHMNEHVIAKKETTNKLITLKQQRDDLINALSFLLAQVETGKMHFRPFYQYKMYNDPDLNPYLSKEEGG